MGEGARVGKPLPARSLGESDAMTVGGLLGLLVTGIEGNRDGATVGTTLGEAVGLWETLGISVGGTSGISVGDKLDFVGLTVGDKVDEKVGIDEGIVDPVGSSLGKTLGFDDGDLLGLTEAEGGAVAPADGAGDGDKDGILVWVSTKAFQYGKSSVKSRSVPIAFSRTTLLVFSSLSMPPFNVSP
jgi:hypothetical protein